MEGHRQIGEWEAWDRELREIRADVIQYRRAQAPALNTYIVESPTC